MEKEYLETVYQSTISQETSEGIARQPFLWKCQAESVEIPCAGVADHQRQIIRGQAHPVANQKGRPVEVLQVHHLFELVSGDGNTKDLVPSRQVIQEINVVTVMRPTRVTNRSLGHLSPFPAGEAVDK